MLVSAACDVSGSCWASVAVVVRRAWWIRVVNFSPTLKQVRDAIIHRQRLIFKAYVYCVKKTAYTDVHVTKIANRKTSVNAAFTT